MVSELHKIELSLKFWCRKTEMEFPCKSYSNNLA